MISEQEEIRIACREADRLLRKQEIKRAKELGREMFRQMNGEKPFGVELTWPKIYRKYTGRTN